MLLFRGGAGFAAGILVCLELDLHIAWDVELGLHVFADVHDLILLLRVSRPDRQLVPFWTDVHYSAQYLGRGGGFSRVLRD